MAPEFVLYLVSASPSYYPGPGTHDWVLVTPDYGKALAAANSTDIDLVPCLVGLAADGSYRELDWRVSEENNQ